MRQLLLTATAVGASACERVQVPTHPIVCDPLPQPITCAADGNMGSQTQRIHATAVWTQVDSSLVARVRIAVYTPFDSPLPDDAALSFAGDPQLTGAKLARVARQATWIEFDCLPNAGATKVAVFVPLTCDAKSACYRIELDVRQPQANVDVPFTLVTTRC
jgi:hypothetical protein